MTYKAGFISLVGLPNAGKSSFLNLIMNEKLSIVSKKPQSTRKRTTGIFTSKSLQAIFVDAPGIVEKNTDLNIFLKTELDDISEKSDAMLVFLNPDAESLEEIQKVLDYANSKNKKYAVLISKKDLNLGNRVSQIKTRLENLNIPFAEISTSMKSEELVEAVTPLIEKLLPDSPSPLFNENQITMEKTKDICAEYIRENCFELLFEEIPYNLAIQVRTYEELDRLVKINADIIVDKDNQRQIVVGAGGSMIKKIGIASRESIEKLLGKKVFLALHVKIKKKWYKDPIAMKELGYVIEKH